MTQHKLYLFLFLILAANFIERHNRGPCWKVTLEERTKLNLSLPLWQLRLNPIPAMHAADNHLFPVNHHLFLISVIVCCWSLSNQSLGQRQEYTLHKSPGNHRTHTHSHTGLLFHKHAPLKALDFQHLTSAQSGCNSPN